MEGVEVMRVECAGDVRRRYVSQVGECILIREELRGPSVELAYGEDRRSLRVLVCAAALSQLLAKVGFAGEGGLWDCLTDERRDVLDLMDLCDQQGVPYSFTSVGSGGDLQFRPMRVA